MMKSNQLGNLNNGMRTGVIFLALFPSRTTCLKYTVHKKLLLFCRLLGVFLLPLDGMLVHRSVTPVVPI